MKARAAIIILILLVLFSAVGSFYILARAERPAKSWHTMNPCFDTHGKWYTR